MELPADRLDMKLTVLRHWLTSILVIDGGEFTLYDRMLEVGVPIHELFAGTEPLSSPPYSMQEFRSML